MSYFSRYFEYLRDNPQGYWFRNKVWGWGWVPARWQGWATLAVFVAGLGFLVANFAHGPAKPDDVETTHFVFKVLVWVAILLLVCYQTGEPPKWQWGFPPKENE